jgi:hypothetical protein
LSFRCLILGHLLSRTQHHLLQAHLRQRRHWVHQTSGSLMTSRLVRTPVFQMMNWPRLMSKALLGQDQSQVSLGECSAIAAGRKREDVVRELYKLYEAQGHE